MEAGAEQGRGEMIAWKRIGARWKGLGIGGKWKGFRPVESICGGDQMSINNILACVWYVCRSHDSPDLLHTLKVRRQPPVAAEDLLVDDGRDGEAVEAVGECLP